MTLRSSITFAALLSLGLAGIYSAEAKVYHCPEPAKIYSEGNRPTTISSSEGIQFTLVQKPEFKVFNEARGGDGEHNIVYYRVMAANSDEHPNYEMTCHYTSNDQEGVYMANLSEEATSCEVMSRGHDNNNNETNTLCDTYETCAVECND